MPGTDNYSDYLHAVQKLPDTDHVRIYVEIVKNNREFFWTTEPSTAEFLSYDSCGTLSAVVPGGSVVV